MDGFMEQVRTLASGNLRRTVFAAIDGDDQGLKLLKGMFQTYDQSLAGCGQGPWLQVWWEGELCRGRWLIFLEKAQKPRFAPLT